MDRNKSFIIFYFTFHKFYKKKLVGFLFIYFFTRSCTFYFICILRQNNLQVTSGVKSMAHFVSNKENLKHSIQTV